jgi:hypothetical protein
MDELFPHHPCSRLLHSGQYNEKQSGGGGKEGGDLQSFLAPNTGICPFVFILHISAVYLLQSNMVSRPYSVSNRVKSMVKLLKIKNEGVTEVFPAK